MNALKKTLAMLLALCLLLGLAACGGSAAGSAAAEPEAPAAEASAEAPAEEPAEEAPAEAPAEPASDAEASAEEAEEAEEPAAPVIEVSYPLTEDGYTFSCWTTYGPGMADYLSKVDALPVYEKAQEITGIGIEFIPCDQSTQPEKLNLYVASGTMPDVMLSMASLYSTGGEGLINDEVAYDLNEYMDLMPYYSLYIEDMDEDIRSNMYTDSGYLPGIFTLGTQEHFGMNIRQDWLDALKLDIPQTYDELENVLTAFKNEYGCRNSLLMLQDFGYTNYGLASGYETMVNAAMNGLHFYQVDGTVYSGDFNEGARDYLSMLADWYQKGLFSDDCLTIKNINDNTNLVYKDDSGVWFSEGEFVTDTYAANAQDPNFKVSPMPEVGKTAGQTLHMYGIGRNLEGQSAWTITTCCEEPELVCQYIDWFFSPEGELASHWGTEGVSYELDENGKPYYTDAVLHSTEYPTAKLALTMYTGTPLPNGSSQEATDALSDPAVAAAGEVYRSNQDGAYTAAYSMTSAEMMEYFGIAGDILTRKAEVVAQIVMGEADISALDDLEAYANEVGLQRAIELCQIAYDRTNG